LRNAEFAAEWVPMDRYAFRLSQNLALKAILLTLAGTALALPRKLLQALPPDGISRISRRQIRRRACQ